MVAYYKKLFIGTVAEVPIQEYSEYSNKELVKNCTKFGICMFCAKFDGYNADDLCMVQCESCSKWFHCACIGVHIDHFDNGEHFSCCVPAIKDTENFL